MIKEFEGLYEVEKEDVKECGRALTEAFRSDPKWGRLFEGYKDRHMNAFYQEPTSYCMKYGFVIAPSKDIEGVMAIVPGKYSVMTPMRVMKTCTFSILVEGGIRLLKFLTSLDSTFEPLESFREEYMKTREYLYIFIIGVTPQKQGMGNGSRMLKALCNYADRINMPIYLETATQKNKNMYERYGFKVIKVIDHPDFDLPQWAMIREA